MNIDKNAREWYEHRRKEALVLHATIILSDIYESLRSHPNPRLWLSEQAPCFVHVTLLSGLERDAVILFISLAEDQDAVIYFGLFPEFTQSSTEEIPRPAWFPLRHVELYEIESIRLILGNLFYDAKVNEALDRMYDKAILGEKQESNKDLPLL